ncbi:MAG: TerB family tellurite resistance protein [Cyclobacteriaceae bacterium]
MSIKSQLSTLIELAKIDGDFDGKEKLHILMVGRANGMSEAEIKEIVENPVPIPDLNTLSDDEKFDYLYNIIQLMKIDSQVYLSEIKYCEDIAEKLGFKKKVVSALSSRIYSDPSITADVQSLKKAVKKYHT